MAHINLNEFLDNLYITQKYCARQLSLDPGINNGPPGPERFSDRHQYDAAVLRSCNPEMDGRKLFTYKWQKYNAPNISNHLSADWTFDLFDHNLVAELFPWQLKIKRTLFDAVGDQMYSGKILACEYEQTVIDGAADAESGGFMDIYDLPPIDTWFYLAEREKIPILYAWIPEKFVGAVQNAIDVSIVDNIYWFSNPENNISDFY